MNKIIIAVIFMCSICFNGCAMQHVSYEIDYGKSEKYSKEDMDDKFSLSQRRRRCMESGF